MIDKTTDAKRRYEIDLLFNHIRQKFDDFAAGTRYRRFTIENQSDMIRFSNNVEVEKMEVWNHEPFLLGSIIALKTPYSITLRDGFCAIANCNQVKIWSEKDLDDKNVLAFFDVAFNRFNPDGMQMLIFAGGEGSNDRDR